MKRAPLELDLHVANLDEISRAIRLVRKNIIDIDNIKMQTSIMEYNCFLKNNRFPTKKSQFVNLSVFQNQTSLGWCDSLNTKFSHESSCGCKNGLYVLWIVCGVE